MSFVSTNLYTGETSFVPIHLNSTLELTNVSLFLDTAMNRVAELSLTREHPEVIRLTLSPRGTNRSLIQFDLDASLSPGGSRTVARLGFAAVPGQSSAIVVLEPSALYATRIGGFEVTNGAANRGGLIIVGNEPILTMVAAPRPELKLYGKPAVPYRIQMRTNLHGGMMWKDVATVRLADRHEVVGGMPTNLSAAFFRALEGPDGGAAVKLLEADGLVMTFRVFGNPGGNYVLEATAELAPPQVWSLVLDFSLGNVLRNIQWTNGGEPSRFFRTRRQ